MQCLFFAAAALLIRVADAQSAPPPPPPCLADTVDLASITSPYTGNTATDGAFVQHMPPVFKRPQRNRN